MKIMPEVQEAMIRAGYRTPDENPLACRNCPSVTRKKDPRMKLPLRLKGHTI